jgi:hypothetical protein
LEACGIPVLGQTAMPGLRGRNSGEQGQWTGICGTVALGLECWHELMCDVKSSPSRIQSALGLEGTVAVLAVKEHHSVGSGQLHQLGVSKAMGNHS